MVVALACEMRTPQPPHEVDGSVRGEVPRVHLQHAIPLAPKSDPRPGLDSRLGCADSPSNGYLAHVLGPKTLNPKTPKPKNPNPEVPSDGTEVSTGT